MTTKAPQSSNPHKPAEALMLSTPVGLFDLGAYFDPHAPFSACRLCGALYQHPDDRICKEHMELGLIIERPNGQFVGSPGAIQLLDHCTARRIRWRNLHERRYHTTAEIEAFSKTGHALTPEAAHRLAPYGITPLGNMSEEIVDALSTAPRKPDDDAES